MRKNSSSKNDIYKSDIVLPMIPEKTDDNQSIKIADKLADDIVQDNETTNGEKPDNFKEYSLLINGESLA